MQTLLQTCFLYFFQLLGIEEDDMSSMEILFGYLKTAKRQSVVVSKPRELTKAQMDKIKFNGDLFALNVPGPKTKAA